MSTRGFVSIGTPDRFRAPLQSFRFLSAPRLAARSRPGSRDGHHAAPMASWQQNGPVRNARRADRSHMT
ncbi:hypothetical protein BXT84_04070 [Sulfobacillus thermotolerans]|uniref:Uncharacterized protein n=1 Tax=Sulfobacillus thermotolerans TaxID=338644 RepID=A0ABM6RPD2_9FIRM|nr:hypothetical protein BXT84_04070 [Sulfobacillus thermotolerans]